LVQKRKIGRDNYFLQNICGFCREKNCKNSGRDGQHLGHLVQPRQLFESKLFFDQGLMIKGKLFSPNPLRGFGICRDKNSKNSGRQELWSLGSASTAV
jgi:hypothetical protein